MSAKSYWELIERTGKDCYYLWGPIQSALLLEFNSGHPDVIAQIALQGPLTEENQMPTMRRDMLIQVLRIASQENFEQVNKFLTQLISTKSPWARDSSNPSKIETKKLVAMIAGEIGSKDILLSLLQEKNEDIRRTAVWSTFLLWQKNPTKGISLLEELGDAQLISRWVLPSRRRLSSCLELTLSILFEGYDNPDTQIALKSIWVKILRRLLWENVSPEKVKKANTGRIRRYFRSAILKVAVNVGMVIARNLEETNPISLYNIAAFDDFFNYLASSDLKKSFEKVVPYLNPEHGDLREIKDNLLTIAKSRDLLSNYLILGVLGAHGEFKQKDAALIIEEILDEIINVKPGLPAIPIMNIALSSSFDGKSAEEIDGDILHLQEKLIQQYQLIHNSTCEVHLKSSIWNIIRYRQRGRVLKYSYTGLSSHPQYAKKKYGEVNKQGILDVFIDNAKQDKNYDLDKIHNYIINVAVPGHPKYRDINVLLECLEPILDIAFPEELSNQELAHAMKTFQNYGLDKVEMFMKKEKTILRKQKEAVVVQAELMRALALIQVYAPEEVEDFMAERRLPREFQKRVKDRIGEEELASAVKGRSIFFFRDEILHKPEGQLSQLFIRWFRYAPRSKSTSHWLSRALMVAVNTLSGEELFSTS